MKMLWCWRCQMEMPMLEEPEWEQLAPLLAGFVSDFDRYFAYQEAGAAGDKAIDPALQKYLDLTGFRETNINALWHHRASFYGEPCPDCGKPLRTPAAKLCPACGWRKFDGLRQTASGGNVPCLPDSGPAEHHR